jgi:hypothetical protein
LNGNGKRALATEGPAVGGEGTAGESTAAALTVGRAAERGQPTRKLRVLPQAEPARKEMPSVETEGEAPVAEEPASGFEPLVGQPAGESWPAGVPRQKPQPRGGPAESEMEGGEGFGEEEE